MNRSLHAVRATTVCFALCSGLVAVGVLVSQSAPAIAQGKEKKAPALDALKNKTFEQCEKVLGKPALLRSENGKYKYFRRYYKKPSPGLTRIVLERWSYDDNPPPKTVNIVKYHFPKGEKTWQEALAAVGVSSQGVHEKPISIDSVGLKFSELENSAGKVVARWTTAENSLTHTGDGRHPEDDELRFE